METNVMKIGLLLAFFGLFALAQEDTPVVVDLSSFLVETVSNEDGSTEEQFSEADLAKPGQVIEYRLEVSNQTEDTLPSGRVVITGPVPEGTKYLAESAIELATARLEFSADGGQTFSEPPVMVEATNEEGETIMVEAEPGSYSAARWTLLDSLGPEDVLLLSYRVVVE